jgi:pyrimidine-specific ribonucleoside hydrolase
MSLRPFVFDMETSDPDDFFTLVLLLGHPDVDLRAVTVTPGTREQIGLVRWVLEQFNKDIPVGSFNLEHPKDCVSAWHYKTFGMPKTLAEAEPGWKVLERTLGPEVTLVTGAPLKNLGKLLTEMGLRLYDQTPDLGKLFIQGGFAGEGVVPSDQQLEKFRGLVTCPSFNLNGDPSSVLDVLRHRSWFSDLRFVSKNVCHGIVYDQQMHQHFTEARAAWCQYHTECDCPCHQPGLNILHIEACCRGCPICGRRVTGSFGAVGRTVRALSMIYRGMDRYLTTHPAGKKFHDPFAACCAIDPEIGEWAEVELYRAGGEWGSYLCPGSGVRIIIGHDPERFVKTLLSLPGHGK